MIPSSDTVTVVIPTRNRPLMVVAAVRSALAQTHAPHEVIVVIDGPDEAGTEQRLRVLSERCVRVLALGENVGGGEARNLGVRAATGKWIAFLDDDALWLPGTLAALAGAAPTAATGRASRTSSWMSSAIISHFLGLIIAFKSA